MTSAVTGRHSNQLNHRAVFNYEVYYTKSLGFCQLIFAISALFILNGMERTFTELF